MIVERTWVCAAFNGEIVNEDVDVVRGHAGLNVFAGKSQDVGGHIAGVTHALDDLGSLDARFVPTWNFTRVGVRRLDDVGGNGAHGGDDAWSNATFETFVATLVLAARTTPAVVVGLGENRRSLGPRPRG
ncbi:unannotated protein [freshwater metagenome]|uniref:Unannotated protein n=1 Tax=freshwater metagenome TaxID=449393 RepID=A0A6J7R926_9ZZZZ